MKLLSAQQLKYLALGLISVVLFSGCNAQNRRLGYTDYRPSPPPKVAPTPIKMGGIYQGQASSFIFEDMKARRVGDVLTIVLSESTNASKSATTSTKKENTSDTGIPSVFGGPVTHNGRNLLGATLDTSHEFTGEGDSEQSNTLSGTITVTVAEVYPNGNLFVRGQKLLYLNQGEEYIQISGIVRQADVGPRNTVASSLLADARITYSGTGAVADSNKMGWLARFFNSSLWPL